MNIKELIKQRNQCVSAADEIRQKYDGVDKAMPADEQERWEKAINDAEALDKQIDLCSREEKLRQAGLKIDTDLPELVRAGAGGEKADDDDFDIADLTAKWAGHNPFRKCADKQSKAVKKYIRQYKQGMSEAELQALSVGDPQAGGYLVGMQIAAGVIEILRDDVYVRTKATVHTLTNAESLGIPTFDTDMADADWTSEIGSGNEDTTTPFGRRELKPQPLAKRVKVSRRLLRLAPQGADLVLSRLAYKNAVTEEKAFISGTGVNQPLGVCTASVQGVSTGQDQSTASANTVEGDDFWLTMGKLKKQYQSRGEWIIARQMETRVRLLKDATNNYIWQPGFYPSQFLVGGMPQTICGRPYSVSEYMPTMVATGSLTTGNYAAVFGDFSFYHIADSLAMEVQRLEELYAESNQIGFILRRETDGMPVLEEAFARLKVS